MADTENRYTAEDLKTMQAFPLYRKIQIAQARIIEWYQKWDGQVIVSFSGGKDSTVLLHIVRQIYPDVEAVFSDTGLEYPEIKQFAKQHENVTIVRPEMSFREVIGKYGYPLISKSVSHDVGIAKRNPTGNVAKNLFAEDKRGPYAMYKWRFLIDSPFDVSDRCCEKLKKNPMMRYQKQSNKKVFVGTMASESRRRRDVWLANGCNIFDGAYARSAPLSIWTEQDVLQYILDYDLPIASVYGDVVHDDNGKLTTTGCKRTGCVFCGFGAHLEKEPNRFQRLQVTHPKLWEYCMRDFDNGGLGMKSVLEYIGVPTGDYSGQLSIRDYLENAKEDDNG